MAGRDQLAKLSSLYAMTERMRSLEVRMAAASVQDAKYAVSLASAVREQRVVDGRAALGSGDMEEWQIAQTNREVAEDRMDCLANVRAEREITLAAAEAVHRASQLQMEQVKRVLERRRAKEADEEERRAQGVSDDRYASRRAWLLRQKEEVG